MDKAAETACRPRIIHELPRRLRIRNHLLHDPFFDPLYLEAILLNISGVESVRLNLKAASIIVDYNGSKKTKDKILNCLEEIPVEVFQSLDKDKYQLDPIGILSKSLLALFTPAIPRPVAAPLSWTLALPVLVDGLDTLISRGVKIEVLDAAAVGFSLLRKDYFTANSIGVLLALGAYLQQLSEDKSTDLLKSLLRPQIETVWVEKEGHEVQIGLDKVVIGDLVVCGTGEMIPVDGVVAEGEASVNLSSITGESVPAHIRPEDEVFSGSLIEEGRIKISAKHVGAETSMARISRFIENSLRFKSESQLKSDELADGLVPITFGLGLLLYLFTKDISCVASVLTVDYSCAIKLANPVAVKMSMYTAAHCGVLLKGSQALDSLARVNTLVFDKTGTLTRGILQVTDVISVGEMTSDELLSLAAGAEEHYKHPVAKAVVGEAKKQRLKLPSIGEADFIVAHGVSAYVNREQVLVGSRHFIADDEKIDCSAADDYADRLRSQGKSILFVAREKILEGIIGLRDELRPEAAQVLSELKEMGIRKIVALTGDHQDTARAIAKELDALDEIHWELKPEDKSDIVKGLKAEGNFLAFAGDGVNDAPALVTADVGICMPNGAELAKEAAQVVLLKEDLNALVAARKIAALTRKTIKNCFRSSVALNTLFLFLASCGILPPVLAAILHNANTVGILGYAALAGIRRPDDIKQT